MTIFTSTPKGLNIAIPSLQQLKAGIAEAKTAKQEKKQLKFQLKTVTDYADKLAACHTDLVRTFQSQTRCQAILKKHGFNKS